MKDLNSYRIIADIRQRAIVAVHITQPQAIDVTRVVIGKPVAVVPQILAQVLVVCAEAQQAAAFGAIEAAMGVTAAMDERRARARRVLGERLLNGLWRLAIDWPRALDLVETPHRVVAARRMLANRDPGLAAVVDQACCPAIVDAMMNAADDRPALHERIAAALHDPQAALAALAAIDSGVVEPLWAGDGGMALTSRGILQHRAEVADGVLCDYAILSPTDRVMAPGAEMEAALIGLTGADLVRRARARIALIDPCAPVSFELADGGHA